VFVMTFVVTKGEGEEEELGQYGDFIRRVREKVTESCTPAINGIPPVLPLEEKLLFHIVLKTKNSSLTAAVRMDNLYLAGFKTPDPGGVWWEFGQGGDTHLINDSKWLGYGSSYNDLHPRRALHTIALGRLQMEYAVDSLAKYPQGLMVDDEDDDPRRTLKQMLARLEMMLCEGLRFATVHRKVDELFDVQRSATINEIEGKQVKYWDKISKAVLMWAPNPGARFPRLEEVGITDKHDAARIIALV